MMNIRRHRKAAVLVCALLIWGSTRFFSSSEAQSRAPQQVPSVKIGNEVFTLSPNVPEDLTPLPPRSLESLQHDFDVLSWNTFVALNWPAKGRTADTTLVIGQDRDAPAVWESWKETYEVFLPDGRKPAAWDAAHEPPPYFSAEAKQKFKEEGRGFSKIAKGHSWSLPNSPIQNEQPFDTGPLIDQDGKYARFEVLINKELFDYVRENNLYSFEGQEDFTRTRNIVFPCGEKGKTVGAIVIKAAWKILNADEIKSGRYHMREAVIYTPKEQDMEHPSQTEIGMLGLVGLHIVHKSKDSAQWTWSTFEQVDNCPTYGEVQADKRYNFFSNSRPDAKINTPPHRPWDPSRPEPPERRSQVVRMIPITKEIKLLNETFQNLLRQVNPNSVWQYYQLISTQWPTKRAPDCDVKASAPVDITGAPAPVFLGNSTLETYIQGQVPNTSSSCMECHANATTAGGKFSDFTYLLQRAQRSGRPSSNGNAQ